jgi:parallel beta-helix repeat protein
MQKRLAAAITLIVLFLGQLMLASNVRLGSAGGPIYIKADGSIDPPTAPIQRNGDMYTLTGNISSPTYNGIVVEKSNITVDGGLFTIQGPQASQPASTGISLTAGYSYVTIRNTDIEGFYDGIKLYYSTNCTVRRNTVAHNSVGVEIDYSANNTVDSNEIRANAIYGILLDSSTNNTVLSNRFSDDGLFVTDSSFLNVVEDNFVNNKRLVYREDYSDLTVDNAGQVILVNCNNITVANLDLSNASVGLELYRTNNSKIANNTLTDNGSFGVVLEQSSNNTIHKNNVANNGIANGDGIRLKDSSNNTIRGNNITGNKRGDGVTFQSSSNNMVYGNNITGNGVGVLLDADSSNDTICHNSFNYNSQQSYGGGGIWDNGNSSGGNYWSNYVGVDLFKGPYQNETGSDGIGDTPQAHDPYPVMNPSGSIPGDIDGDLTDYNGSLRVGVDDNVLLAKAYGTTNASGGKPGDWRAWNPNADINGDGKVGLADLFIMSQHWGQHYP